ncbi:chromodomain-helicase-DNA-binding protein 6 isoform X4 [Dasypus novemcinctus]|uniref:chromodomain-helicase-DNA-binding protein 6 isoform X4 n=1 Tax=Dasypus novemcinctus TaxID=9361 RepID=UPI00062AA250|nr:chromodomain-helicase-DNA-binding protein 6 isoform X2 [Dasypus novemcinctus]
MIMKIQKKEKQLSNLKVLNHSPMSDASVSFDYKSPSPFDCSTDQEEKIEDVASQCLPQKDQYAVEEEADTLFSRKMTSHNGMENSGGGGTGVKKKRKKKDPGEQEGAAKRSRDREPKPKRKREPKEPKEPRKTKEPKKAKEPKELKQKDGAKKARKPREASGTKEAKEKRSTTDSLARTKSKKASKEQGPTPVEKKKKGKRKNETTVESLELDQGLPNSSLRSPEDCAESTDSQKRRSGRQVKRRKYNEDLDFKVVDDDGETIAVLGAGRTSALSASTLAWQAEEPPEDDANIIEKILASKMVQEVHPGEPPFDLELFYVKYRNFSYLHCKWATMEELEKDPRIAQKIKRFRNKQAQMKHIFTEPDEDLFNPDYVEVDRILEVAHTKDAETGEEVTHYLVKWCSLPYEESTWELEEDVDPAKVKEFESLQVLPEIKHMERPASDSWQKLDKSREYKNSNQLREYQLEGMNWLLFNWYNRKNCILADEMGLGKTIQSITFLSEIFLRGIHGPFLIIAPLSTITNWEREFRTWTEMNAIVYHGSQISRQMIQQYEMVYRDAQGNPLSGVFKFHVVITTFEMILADCPELKKIHWSCVIIDEAHRLKNRNCKLLEGLKLMALEHKVLLTGTPLQNSVEELFSLLNFLEPSQFPSETAFLEEFGDLKTEEQVKKLQSILKPMMLRRLKDDVEKNLAPKQETIIEVELTNIQKKYYRAILEKNFSFLAKGANQHNMPNLINTMMELRKCCNHPYLINGAEEKILEDFRKTHSPDASDFQLQAMIQAAGKLVLIDKLLPKLIAGGHKVLIFSQMVRCLDILEDYLIQRRYTYERIDGRVRGNLRQAAIDRFCKPDSDRFVFLLCTRAGGLGINLTAADTCIIFDSDWNPQNDLQAQARCHRIGQSKAVKVYRLITRNSYEREMFDKASLKLGLDKAVLQDINRKGSTNGVQQLSKMEVEDLLRKGAYGALMDEEDEGSKFCEEDIDQILQRRTHTITIQSEGKGSTFAKASFVASGNRTDISLDDPNFWQKWAKIAELDTEAKNEKESLVIDRPRVRKQTKHYNSFEEDELMEFSELDSDSDERPTRSRRLNDKTRRYLRAECFRVEKNLLIFGWGRWKDILTHGRFKWHLNEKDMEMICRALLVYCVKHYKGDEKIKSFIWELITPTKDGQAQTLQNHSGLSAPVPRGRKGKKTKNQLLLPELKNADWLATCNPEVVLHDDGYKKHLKQHCNKVLLRVRMLYYLKAEILGEAADKAFEGTPARELEVPLPDIDYVEIPVDWWDAEADKSLLIGVFKHGYERYNAMRADPALCFLEKVGMPDEKSLSAEQGVADGTSDIPERGNTDKEDHVENKLDSAQKQTENSRDGGDGIFGEKKDDSRAAQDGSDSDKSPWPVSSALTARLRRLVTVYQRCNRKEPCRPEILGPANQGYWVQEEMFRRTSEMDLINKEAQKRWTRREQADFYRTVSSFGVVYDQEKKTFDWTQFRIISRLDKKSDESLEHYFYSFVAMCRNVCRLPLWKDGSPDPTIYVEPITEERAARTLYRIELLRKIREQVLKCPQLHERLQLCRPSLYLPVWWECGKHDRDLLIGTAKHGLNRTDYYIMNDPQLSFLDAYRNYAQHKRTDTQAPESLCCLYQTNSKLYESLAYTQMNRTSESLENEPENLLKIENRDDHLSHPGGSLPDMVCENFISKVQDVISINHDDSLLPESLESMIYDYPGKYSEEESKSSTSGIIGDIGDDLQEARAPTIAQLLQEKTLYSFSEWPKDRVIINRLDNICHVVLKGKWPSGQQYEPSGTLPTPLLSGSATSRNSLLEPEASEHSFSNGAALVAQVQKESFLAPVFTKDEQKHRRPYEFEVERDAKARSLEQFSASHGHPPIVLNGWHGESAIDLSCTSEGSPGTTSPFPVSSSTPKIGAIGSLQGALGMDLSGILQAGLIHPVTGQIVNGSLRRDDAATRRRRGRRKHVEGGMDFIFLKEPSLQAGILEVHEDPGQATLSTTTHSEGPVPATSAPETRTAASGQAEKAIPSKSLLDWLRQQSDYSLEVPGFGTNFSDKPKQRRPRCKEPGKLDANSLSGEERVPTITKEPGPRGFLPENKFNHTLTEPVLRDAGPRRRGRRPRSELLKAPAIVADSPSGMGPLLMNGLIAGMDLVGLQNMRNMPGIPLTGLVGFPASFATMPTGEDVKSTLSMLPMMLPGMATVPQMFGVGGLLSTPMATTCTSSAPASLSSTTKSGTSATEKTVEDKPSSRDVKMDSLTEDKPGPSPFSDQSEPTITTSNPVAFNPFLIPGVSPGLIYPSMFLSPGMGMALPSMQQARHSEVVGLENQKRKKKKTKGDNPNPNPEPAPGSGREPSSDQNCTEPSAPLPPDRDHVAQAGDGGLKDSNNDTN